MAKDDITIEVTGRADVCFKKTLVLDRDDLQRLKDEGKYADYVLGMIDEFDLTDIDNIDDFEDSFKDSEGKPVEVPE